jgi:hypothetical protein
MTPRRVIAAVFIVVLTALIAVYGGNSGVATWLGTRDRPPATPLMIDELCDGSRGSSCTEATLTEVLRPALAAAAARPGSTVRVWVQGADIESTRSICAVTSSKPRRAGRRAIRDFDVRWIAKSSEEILATVRPQLGVHVRRSPIAEAITRVAMAPAPPEAERWIVAVTDGLEVSGFGDFECARLPHSAQFVRSLQREHLLGPASLAAIRVRMCHLDLAPVDGRRCPMTLARAVDMRALWRAAFKAAGAADVELTEGAPALFNEANNTEANKTKENSNDQ